VVPRSMPITLAMCFILILLRQTVRTRVSASEKSDGAVGRAEAVPYGASKR
jgi:hypothetical protein